MVFSGVLHRPTRFAITMLVMGEWNDPAPDAEAISGDVLEYLAKYLYECYETNPHPMRDDDPRNTCLGMAEPWESAGKRMRERWFGEAQSLVAHIALALVGAE